MLVRAPSYDPALGDRARGISALPLINIIMVACASRVRPQCIIPVVSAHATHSVYGCSHIAAIKPVSSQVCETRDPSQSVGTTCPCT